MSALVSICIPTYQQPVFLREALDSIAIQTYPNIEVIISDDSPDDSVERVLQPFTHRLNLTYQHNFPSLGSPANWNAALKRATGQYILLLHHDDRFASPDALRQYVEAFERNAAVQFVFGRNTSIEKLARGRSFSSKRFTRFYRDPSILITANIIGAPSNVMLRKGVNELYDERFKWIVDIEMYGRLFRKHFSFAYIDKWLVTVGIHKDQMTNFCMQHPSIVLYENVLYAAENLPSKPSLAVFDFYWRLLRNAGVRTIRELQTLVPGVSIPHFISRIVRVQAKFPAPALNLGPLSKSVMTMVYLTL